jgi:hypothetical protein
MRKIRIITVAILIIVIVQLTHDLGYTSLPWKGVSFYYRAQKLGATMLNASLSIEREDHRYLVKAAIDTTGVTFPFFYMHNRFRSYINIKDKKLEPWRYVKEVNQWGVFSGKKYYTDILTFDLTGLEVNVERVNPYHVKEVSIPPETYDPLAIFLKYFLSAEVVEGDKILMRIYDGIEIREVIFITTSEEISTPLYGEIRTIRLESKVPFSSLGNKEGIIKIWYTNDERKFPVDISFEIPIIATVRFQLEKVEVW